MEMAQLAKKFEGEREMDGWMDGWMDGNLPKSEIITEDLDIVDIICISKRATHGGANSWKLGG
jgi:hypothetical protein